MNNFPDDQISLGLGLADEERATVKEEEAEEVAVVPKPLQCLHESGPPPFLTKTYEMVDDPEADPIVSWGESGCSFVVWDQHKFSTDLLPRFFKHSNFSSFIRQLNTYGFRKVHLDRWEFANAGFQRGKKHLLKTIKRRNHNPNHGGPTHGRALHHHLETHQSELEDLRRSHDTLKLEILDLRQRQVDSNKCLAAMEERLRVAEWKQRQFVLLLAKAMKRTAFFQQLLDNYNHKRKAAIDDNDGSKKRRLAGPASADEQEMMGSVLGPGCVNHQEQQNSSGLTTTSDITSGSPDLSTGNYIMWEKLMEDDVICDDEDDHDENEGFVKGDNDSKASYMHELEDLIEKPLSWTSFANVGEVACPIGQ